MRGKILSSKGNVYVVLGEDGIFYNVFPFISKGRSEIELLADNALCRS